MADNRKYYRIAEYHGSATYEPAEGGYYVPETYLCSVSQKFKEKHGRRAFREAVRETSELFGNPDCLNRNYAHWTTGKYVGDEYELRLTANDPENYERIYHGYE